jgi:hypothetical protein
MALRWLSLALALAVASGDDNSSCDGWAAAGECTANPGYMLDHCKSSCAKYAAPAKAPPASFYDIKEKDIDGNVLDFADLKNSVVLITNTASA